MNNKVYAEDEKDKLVKEDTTVPTFNRTHSVTFGGVQLLKTPDEEESKLKMLTKRDPDQRGTSSILRKTSVPMDTKTARVPSGATRLSDINGMAHTQDNPHSARPQIRGKFNKPFVNFVVIGHVDAGKSTLIGHLAYLCKGVDKETMNRLAREADLAGRASFKYAWVMDKLKAERQRGVSIDSKLRRFETTNNYVIMIDAPGHRDYVHNMITGTSQADVAILVVSAERGEFETGLKKNGQTREHLHIAYSMGIKQLIVIVNKMETTTPAYSQTRFNNIEGLIRPLSRRVGFEEEAMIFIPASAFDGDNLIKRSDKMDWFDPWKVVRKSGGASGSTLLEAIEQVEVPTRMPYKPLRVPIHTVYKLGEIGIVTAGRVHSGCLKPNTNVVYAPNNVKAKVRGVQLFREVMSDVTCGDNVGIQIENKTLKDIKKGDVCGELDDDPPKKVEQFTAQILILNHPGTIKKGYTPILNVHTASTACKFIEIKERSDRRTGQKAEDFPTCLTPGQVGIVEMAPLKPISLECFFDYPSLGRIVIRDLKQTVAVGVVIDLPGRVAQTDEFKIKSGYTRQSVVSSFDTVTPGNITRSVTMATDYTTPATSDGIITRPESLVSESNTTVGLDNTADVVVPQVEETTQANVLSDNNEVDLESENRTFTTMSGKLESEL